MAVSSALTESRPYHGVGFMSRSNAIRRGADGRLRSFGQTDEVDVEHTDQQDGKRDGDVHVLDASNCKAVTTNGSPGSNAR